MFDRLFLSALAFTAFLVGPVLADDWVAVKLRGTVLQLAGGQWQPLKRGDVVSDDRTIRTLDNGRVEFQREAEIISLGPETQIQIHDKSGQRFTTVRQQFGRVTIDAEVRNVQHFAVQTGSLAAIVKGTRFVVTAGKGWSKVDVVRGQVAVESERTHSSTMVVAGQSATAATTSELEVTGKGKLPAVVGATGKVVPADPASLARALKEAAKAATGAEKKALEAAARDAEKKAKEDEKDQREAEKARKAKKDDTPEQTERGGEHAGKGGGHAAKGDDDKSDKPGKDNHKGDEHDKRDSDGGDKHKKGDKH